MGPSLPDPIELCLEELNDASDAEPYVRCVAVAGGCPGLCFSPAGEVIWRLNDNALAEIWVSLDGRLMLFRKSPQGQVALTRVERHLELPLSKPVIVLGGDEISVAGRRFRVHVHGTATEVKPPERLKLRRARNLAVAAAVALGALAADCKQGATGGSTTPIEVRQQPPIIAPSMPRNTSASDTSGDAGVPDAGPTKRVPATHTKPVRATPPIEIRRHPPKLSNPRPPKPSSGFDDPPKGF
jgi:hypothetical protein